MTTTNRIGVTTFMTPSDREIGIGLVWEATPTPSTCRTGCSVREAGPCPSARSTSAGRGVVLRTGMKEGMSESFNRLAEYL
jgi:hypothetical protein